MNKIKFILILLLLLPCHAFSQSLNRNDTGSQIFFVSLLGNDRWTGRLSAPSKNGKDGPFATVQRALEVIRELKSDGCDYQFTILVRGGVYRMDQPIYISPKDSGTESKPLIIRAYENECPVLSGAMPVTGFKPYKGNIYVSDLKGMSLERIGIKHIFADGKRQILARFPNFDPQNHIGGGYLYVQNIAEKGSRNMFRYGDGAVRDWSDTIDAEIVVFPGPNYWNNIISLAEIDRKNQVVTLAGNTSFSIEAGNRYYFQNIFQELDSPGEWYFDRRDTRLYYWPANRLSLNTVTVPILKSLVIISEKNYSNKHKFYPTHIRFEGFTLDGCNGDAIVINNARNIVVAKNTITNAGGCGIAVIDGTSNKAIGNDVSNIGGVGIHVSGGDRKTLTPSGHQIDNNNIHHIGIINKKSSAIECSGVGNIVSNNLIHSTPRIGIRFDGNDNIIEYNQVHHVNQETQDSGAIYSCARDWTKQGNIIRFNYVHHSGGYGRKRVSEPWQAPFYTWGIYLDDFSSGTEVYGNIVTSTVRGGIFIHGGRDNTIQNNIIIEAGHGQMVYSAYPPEFAGLSEMFAKIKEMGYTKYPLLSSIVTAQQGATMSGNKFKNNIIMFKDKKSILYDVYGPLDLSAIESDQNVIYHPGLPLLVSFTGVATSLQWTKWKGYGLDRNSVEADPLFYDSASGRFQLSPASPAFKLGFIPIPFEKIGLYEDPLRASWPVIGSESNWTPL